MKGHPINFMILSQNKSLTWDIILKYPDKYWNWHELSKNMPLNIILSNPNKPWNWHNICYYNTVIDHDALAETNHKNIRWGGLSFYVSLNIIRKYSNKTWNWYNISKNQNVTIEFIREYINKPWAWYFLSEYINITWDMYLKSQDLPWKTDSIVCNKNILKLDKKELIPQYFAAKKIWRYWFHANTNPEYMICRKRLEREYYDM